MEGGPCYSRPAASYCASLAWAWGFSSVALSSACRGSKPATAIEGSCCMHVDVQRYRALQRH